MGLERSTCYDEPSGQPMEEMRLAENAIRPVTLGRKNWLFAGI